MDRCVLLKFGEMTLKGRNRGRFVQRLRSNLRGATADLGPVEIHDRGGLFCALAPGREGELTARALDLFGVNVVSPALKVEPTTEALVAAALALLERRDGPFAVKARRRDKRFALTSQEIQTLVGREIQDAFGLAVDLTNPAITLYIEVDAGEIFVYTERLPGRGGLPVGSSGRALVLISGGIDSPVAAYRVMKRGLRCDFVHFSGQPFTGPESLLKAYALVAALDRFQGGSRLWAVRFGAAQRQLATAGAGRLQVLAQRRLMVRVAAELAHRAGADALVTGDALGQVASQTLANLSVVEDAAGDLPLLRPLVGWDKREIVDEARTIGSLDVSTMPAEDCCILFSSPRAETRARIEELRAIESRVELDELVAQLADDAERLEPRTTAAPDGLTAPLSSSPA